MITSTFLYYSSLYISVFKTCGLSLMLGNVIEIKKLKTPKISEIEAKSG